MTMNAEPPVGIPEPATTPEVQIASATAVAPVAAAPEAPIAVPGPVNDISAEEFAAGLRTLEQAMAVAWTSREQTAKELIGKVEDQDAQKTQLAQLELEKAQWQTAQALIPLQLQQRHAALQEISRRTGVPVTLLATAKTEQDVQTIVTTWVSAHPRPAAPVQAPVQATPPAGDQIQPVSKIDSGINTGAGSAGQEPWRNLSASDRVAFALRG